MSLLNEVRETMRRDRVFDFVAESRFPLIQGRRVVRPDQVDISHGPILYLENISVSFDGFKALNDLTMYIDAGELRCIIGPNGAGKTTMMDVITGKTRPDEGRAFFGQTMDLTRMTEYEIATAGIGRKFQKPTVFPQHTVFQNLELAPADAGEDVTQAIIVTDFAVLVMGRGVARLGGQLAGVVRQRPVVGDKHAAARRGDDCVAVE